MQELKLKIAEVSTPPSREEESFGTELCRALVSGNPVAAEP